ncbi:curli biogenesis system outer membrane secretion channel CsgG [Deinobacterium chartae]|uniref:Curli biogenesis system outer membrane secretion channel CsgG n=1 Tax=Deinobacterium chartae TaxID=521158 RepID=A0A841HZN5_9DEIO|nr:hypothetical protein [Deinobacterium chartae]MBB6097342.1 curli biogenesis system outer membrane secretion channel CsgG [Deinobacterium chartae]
MKRRALIVLGLSSLLAACAPTVTGPQQPPYPGPQLSLAVFPLSCDTRSCPLSVHNRLTDKLLSHLAQSAAFRLVEPPANRTVVTFNDQTVIATPGARPNSDLRLVGSITAFEPDLTSSVTKWPMSRLTVNLRVLDARSGEVIAIREIRAEETAFSRPSVRSANVLEDRPMSDAVNTFLRQAEQFLYAAARSYRSR